MKGRYKKKNTCFKKGHASFLDTNTDCTVNTHQIKPAAPYVRLSPEDTQDLLLEEPDTISHLPRDSDDQICTDSVRLLRPHQSAPNYRYLSIKKKSEEDAVQSDMLLMKLFHPIKLEQLWQEGIQQHPKSSPNCSGVLRFDGDAEIQVGLCFQERLKCTVCSYKTTMHKLYDEVRNGKRGPMAAAPNIGIQVGLTHTGIGNTGFRNILMSANIAPPALSGMQRHSNSVSEKVIKLNEDDMNARCQKLKDINVRKGLGPDAPVRIEGDGRWNNPLYGGSEGQTPFQPGTQAIYTVCENVTPKKQIIALSTNNKLCQTAALINNKTKVYTPCCSGGEPHEGHCSATIPPDYSIGDERRWATECLEDLSKQGLNVKYFTTDCDSRASSAAEDFYFSGKFTERTVHLKCGRHLASSQRKLVKRTVFSDTMFPGRTKEIRTKQRARFAHDIRDRVTAEVNSAHKLHKGDPNAIIRKLSYTTDAIVNCIQGDHSDCRKHSFACKGPRKPYKFKYLNSSIKLLCSTKDLGVLRDCLLFRLSRAAVMSTRFNTSTQKTEAVNRAYSLRNPKNLTFSRNYKLRVHSTAHQVNNGHGDSMRKQCKAVGSPIVARSRVDRNLQAKQQRQQYQSVYRKTQQFKTNRSNKRINKYKLYDNKEEHPTYQSELLNFDTINENKKRNKYAIHTYCKI